MRRREFITLLGGAAAWPLAARAQQRMPVLGWLNPVSALGIAMELAAFKRGLQETGYVEGRNLAIEYRWAGGHFDRLPALAADLVSRKVAVVAATGGATSALAVKALTSTIPIVFTAGADPVAAGLVTSLARPGGNLTGTAALTLELASKKLELLHEALPGTSAIAALVNHGTTVDRFAESQISDLQKAAGILGLQLSILRANTDQEIDSAFATVPQLRVGGLVIASNATFLDRSERLAALSLRHAVPAISYVRSFAAAGGFMSYGAPIADNYHLAGVYVGRILNGEKPGDLPVQQSTKFNLVINLKTAKALGITVPITLLGRADEVIE
jgi:putative ABC transport system substrate-binding protein